ncbi:MAG: AMP-binding protein, partial [Porticoccus sp.]
MKILGNLYRMLEKNSRRPFLVLERDVVSYGQLHSRIGHFVGLFNEHQIKPSQRIVVCSDDEGFVASVVAAAFFHGIASVILSAETTSARALAIIKQSEPALVLLDEQLQSVWQLKAEQATFSVAKKSRT